MPVNPLTKEAATALLLEEADCLDNRRWRDWLTLFREDAVYWVPSWHDDNEMIDNPHGEISLIYCGDRGRIAERVWRIESGLSSSLLRLPRTRHFLTNIRVSDAANEAVVVTANFMVNTYKHEEKRTDMFFGHYRHILIPAGDALLIKEKHIVVCNDVIPRQMDIFNV